MIGLQMQNHIRQFFAPKIRVTVVKHQSIKPVFKEEETFIWLLLGSCTLFQLQNFFALNFLAVFFCSMLLKVFHLVNAESDIVPLQVELPNK